MNSFRRIGVDIAFSLLFLLLQTTLLKFLAINTIVPDILLIWIAYVAIRQGQIAATTTGFFLGLAMDLLSGRDGMLGLAALSKTAGGFVGGYFFNENKTAQTLQGFRFITVVLVISIVHNLIYFLIFLQGTGLSWWDAVVWYGVPTSLYTAATALLPMFAFARKYLS